ncbi:FCD domain-containing protein [Janibacter sp. DB-40]|uniref:FadR/GntR family transcriptional regulator n=1 Tax=Janibacter sp. DB-40 TaxID=3028808 RepID=UPI002405E646|nr:FCD domain-containing protein [Janibacter sp. DB-40]
MLNTQQSLRALIQDGIAEGNYVPGAKLPTERELVERLSAPRSSVRRALEELEAEGLIIRHVGRGTFLTESAQPEGAPADSSPASIMQARLVIEPPIAAVAARAATASDLDRVAECLAGGGAADDFIGFESWDAKLHRCIAEAAHNGLLLRMFDVMNSARALPIWGNRKRQTSSPERRRCYHLEHTEIVDALLQRDPEAAELAMRNHLRTVNDNILGRP